MALTDLGDDTRLLEDEDAYDFGAGENQLPVSFFRVHTPTSGLLVVVLFLSVVGETHLEGHHHEDV